MLRYVNTDEPGLRRRRCGGGFVYIDTDGKAVADPEIRRRLAALAVPPAWTDVWLCRDSKGHIQATGRDQRGRKQYVYHPEWREQREQTKYAQLGAFAEALPAIRRRVDADLATGAPDERGVLAAAVRLLDLTGIRVGNTSYFEENGTVGLTTLQDRHAEIVGSRIVLRFKAKSGRQVDTSVASRRVARLLLRCEELEGQRLFRYRSGDDVCELDSIKLNSYLREIAGADVTAKHFRTWIGTVTVVERWLERGAPLTIKEAAASAAKRLENTQAVTRRSYIHPGILAIATARAPTAHERAGARRARAQLSGAEALCARLLAAALVDMREAS
ncbi:MAG TPA: DNA topoisomerase IB [Gammaproteobacteria bacterium]|nr:DNA topoisomerase IB [Gammaproteobacteria bacterium]